MAGSVGGASGLGSDPRLAAADAALEELRSEIDDVGLDLGVLERRVAGVDADLAELRDVLVAADAQLAERRRELEHLTARSTEVVTSGRTAGEPVKAATLAQVRAPLRVVNGAIRANDALGIELLGQQNDARGRAAAIGDLLAGLRRATFDLDRQERVARTELTEAIRSAATIADAAGDAALRRDADAVIARARDQLHRIDLARSELRLREAAVLRESTRIHERLSAIEGGMREVRRTTKDLYAEMTVAEAIVSSRLEGWQGSLGDVVVALDGVLRVCPVDEPRSYSDNWHAPRWGGGFHLHQGIDIFAPTGTPIRAPFDGTAVSADNWLGGIAVKVYGDAGYVYNAHLSERGALGPVKAGDIIGYVGSTGNASGPHDHFEYHPGNGDAVNPILYLDAVC